MQNLAITDRKTETIEKIVFIIIYYVKIITNFPAEKNNSRSGEHKYKMEVFTMSDQSYYDKADEILAQHGTSKKSLIPVIQDIQAHYRYLPPELLSYVAKKLGIGEAKAYSVATFYENFSFEAKGKYIIKVCDGTACHVRKSTAILNRLKEELGLFAEQHTTEDMLFTLETVSCLGACGLAPALTVNDKVYPAMTPEKVTELIAALKKGEE